MVEKPKPMSVRTKRGDDFRLQMAVRDRNNEDAIAAYEDYQTAYANWREAVNADPPNDVTIAALEVIKDNKLTDWEELCVVDISNWDIKCAIAWGGKTYGIGEVVIEDAENGIYSIYISKDITYWLKPREYILEVQYTFPTTGDVITSQDMIFIVDRDIVDSEEFANQDPPPLTVPGPQGPPGPEGPEGPIGPTGAAGTNGTNGTNGADGADGEDYNVLTNKTVSGSTYTMVNSDFVGNTQISFTGASCVITIPAGLTNVEPCVLIQVGTGQASVVADGVTLISSYGFNFAGQGAVCGLLKRSTDSYVFVGDMVE